MRQDFLAGVSNEKQKKGNAKMKHVGQVQVPQKAFIGVLAADRK
ncbi:MAG: hypothetical protein ABSG68_18715 [Thermoguttaceae bacterium]